MDVYGDDLDQYFNRLIADFDHFDVDEKTDKFMNKFRQNQNEPTRIFRQRFNSRMDRLIMLGRMSSFKDDPDRHNGEQSLFFYQKLNNTVKSHVSKRIKEAGKTQQDYSIDDIMTFAMEIEENIKKPPPNPSAAFTRRNRRDQDRKNPNGKKCYYCESSNHFYKDRNGNKNCPEAKAKKEPCANFKRFLREKHNFDWDTKTYLNGSDTRPPTDDNAAFADAEQRKGKMR